MNIYEDEELEHKLEELTNLIGKVGPRFTYHRLAKNGV